MIVIVVTIVIDPKVPPLNQQISPLRACSIGFQLVGWIVQGAFVLPNIQLICYVDVIIVVVIVIVIVLLLLLLL